MLLFDMFIFERDVSSKIEQFIIYLFTNSATFDKEFSTYHCLPKRVHVCMSEMSGMVF